MNLLYLRTLLIMVCVWAAGSIALAQPNGNYGPRNVDYSVPSNAYFVSPNGNGTQCSKGNPCSLSRALSSAPSGATIVLMGGTYRTSDYDAKIPRRLTLQPYPGASVTLKGSKIVNSWRSEGGAWKTSWSKLFPAKYQREKKNVITRENPMAAYQDMVFVNGKELRQVGSRGEVKSGTFYVDYRSKTVYVGSNPHGKTVEITGSEWGLHTHGVSSSGITIRGLKFMHYAETGIMMKSPDAVIENNEFIDNAIAGIKVYNAKRVKVKNNRFSYNGLQGLGANFAEGLVFENNLVTNNNTEKHNRNSWSAAGAKILDSRGAVIRNNMFKDNDANGIWLDHRSDYSVIVNNVSKKNARFGIHCEISHNVIIAGNVVTDCGRNPEGLIAGGVMVAESANVKVFNNTVVDNVVNITVSDGSRYATRNTVIKNNLISNASIKEYPSSQIWVRQKACSDVVVKDMDHNGYHRSSSSQPDLLARWKIDKNSCNKSERLATISDLKSKFKFDQNGISINGSQDPFFSNRSADNFTLKRGSAAVKAGESLPDDVRKALGWNTSGKVDLGAYQSGYSASSAPSSPSQSGNGKLPWKESFDLSDGATSDNGGTSWSLEKKNLGKNAIVKVSGKKLTARGTVNEVVWRSQQIKLGGKTAKVSVDLSSRGALESSSDYIKVYYRINGKDKMIGEVRGNVSGTKRVSAGNIKGDQVQVIVKIKNSDISEHYFVDNIAVEGGSSGSKSSAPTASSASLPWKEHFNARNKSFKGGLETHKLYKNGIFEVQNGKLTARGVGEAAWKSDVIKLKGKTANFSLVLNSKGRLESGHDNVKVYYKLNNGNEKLAEVVKGRISGYKKVVVNGLKGSSLQIIVRFKNSDISEHYFLDSVNIVGSGTKARKNNTDKSKEEDDTQNLENEEIFSREQGVEVYPNPVVSYVEVRVNNPEAQQARLTLLDLTGKQILEQQIGVNQATQLDLSGLQKGVYMLQVIDDLGEKQTKRIIKQ